MACMKAVFAYACALLCIIVSLVMPAFANDLDLKKQIEEINAAYMENFKNQDATALAALYAADPIMVNETGTQAISKQFYEAMFNAGFTLADSMVDQAWTLGADTALAKGKYRLTGKTQNGSPIEVAGLWTAAYVRDAGKWKVRMLTAIPTK